MFSPLTPINYGKRKAGGLTASSPGDTLYIPFATYNDSGASIGIGGTLAVSDIEIFKNGGATARATDSGYSLISDTGQYGNLVGLHRFSVQLFNNSDDTGFFDADSQYHVAVDSITVDGRTVRLFPAVFEIGDIDVNIEKINSDTGAAAALATNFADTGNLADNIWDEVLTGATHNVNNSAGRRLRQVEGGLVLHAGTADTGNASNTIDLETGSASTIDDFYNHNLVSLADGTGAGQVRIIVDYDGSSQRATIAPPWSTEPDATTSYEVLPGYAHAETNSRTVKVGLVVASTSNTVTLSSTASSVDDYYRYDVVMIDAGTGEGQERIITAYNGTTKVATIEPAWITNPDTTSEYIVEEALAVADLISIGGDTGYATRLGKFAGVKITDSGTFDTGTGLVRADVKYVNAVQVSGSGDTGTGDTWGPA